MPVLKIFLPATLGITLASLLTGCQSIDSTQDRTAYRNYPHNSYPRHTMRSPDRPAPVYTYNTHNRNDRIYHHNSQQQRQIHQQLQQACAGKPAGHVVTIRLQNGQAIKGKCETRFAPPPLAHKAKADQPAAKNSPSKKSQHRKSQNKKPHKQNSTNKTYRDNRHGH